MRDVGQEQPSDDPGITHIASAGTTVAVKVYGPPCGSLRGVPVVLLPGLFVGEYLWRYSVPFLLKHGFPVITICEPTAMIDSSIQNLKRHIIAIVETLGLDSAIVCGNSIGGVLAVEFAATFPERTRAIMVSGAPGLGNDYGVDIGARWTFDRASMERLAERLVHDKGCVPPSEVDAMACRFADRRFRRNLVVSLRVAMRHSLVELLPEVMCPVLLVWGEEDSLTSATEWRSSMHHFPDASFHAVPNCGHAPMFERPDVFNPMLLAFLERHSTESA